MTNDSNQAARGSTPPFVLWDFVSYCAGRGFQVLIRKDPEHGHWLVSVRQPDTLAPRGSSCHADLATACEALRSLLQGEGPPEGL